MSQLTNREEQVLNLIFDDFSTKEISSKLGLTDNTVNTYRKRIIEKLNVKSMFGAYKKYINK